MTAAVDTNALLDLLSPDSPHFEYSFAAMRVQDGLIVSEVVLAELASEFEDEAAAKAFLESLGVGLVRTAEHALHLAGNAFSAYLRNRQPSMCPNCRATITSRQHILADFMIGAHALVHAGRLLTRDRGYYRTYFPELVLV
jgi:predicted nucleic acid-binding protein